MIMDIQLPEWLQLVILIGAGALAVWLAIVLVAVYQTAGEISDFIAAERHRHGYGSRPGPSRIEPWDRRTETERSEPI